MISLKSIPFYFFFCLGFFSTAQTFALVRGGTTYHFFSLTLYIVILYLFLNMSKDKKTKDRAYIYFKKWLIISVISSLYGYLFFEIINLHEFSKTSLSFLPKIVGYLIFVYLFKKNDNSSLYSEYLIKGLLFGFSANAIWALIDAVVYYMYGYSINNMTFNAYIMANDVRYEMLSIISNGRIRSAGFNADPANIGLFSSILAFYSLYSKNLFYLLLALIGAMSSISTTALLGILGALFYFILTSKKVMPVIFLILFVIILLYILFNVDSYAVTMLRDGIFDRAVSKTESGGDEARLSYNLNFLPCILQIPSSLVIGTGFLTASYPYLIGNYIVESFKPYDPEQTYISTFFDCGLIGFFFFCLLLKFLYIKFKATIKFVKNDNNNNFLFAGIMGMLLSFCTYHYTLYSVEMLIFICCIFYNINSKQSLTNDNKK